jgi:eukaryotic-like serine/threonine-protein kinase
MNAVAVVGDDIQLLRLLGRGGMGTVWLGRRAGELVAVKMMLPAFARQPRAVARFERELRILQKMRAGRAVRLVATGTHEGHPFAVMENVAGTSLADRFDAHGKPPPAIAFRIVRQLLMALSEVHAEGVVHRDVKPANIMLCGMDDTLDVCLVDFGVASSDGEGRAAPEDDGATVVGTGPYMSPEQLLEGGAGTIHEDMWAAAVLAYECVMGRIPFEGPSFAAVCRVIETGVFVTPSVASPDLPPSIDGWFARAFRRDLGERFSNVAEMAEAWDAATGGEDTSPGVRAWDVDAKRDITAPFVLTRRSGRPAVLGARRSRPSRRRYGAWTLVAAFAAAALVICVAAACAPH